mgnify:CR=1 FL=1
MVEADLLRTIRDAARVFGWIDHHDEQSVQLDRFYDPVKKAWRSRKRKAISSRGFPDLVLVRRKRPWQDVRGGVRLLFLELKRDLGPEGGESHAKLTPEQLEWREALEAIDAPGVRYMLVRPADLDRVLEILETGR